MTRDPRDFPTRLKETAGEAGIYSPRELARILGVQVHTVNQWYSGKSMPNGQNLTNLLSILRVEKLWLIDGRGPDDDVPEAGGDPTSDFNDAMAVLKGMAGLLTNRSDALEKIDANKIGRTIERSARNAERHYMELHALYLDKCREDAKVDH